LVNSALHLIVSIDVDGVSIEGDAGGVAISSEVVDDKFEFNSTIRGENILRLNSGELKRPVLNGNNLGSQVSNVGLRAALERINSLLGEVAWDVEIVISNQEVRMRFLNIALDGSLSDLIGNFGEVTVVVENKGVKVFE